MSTPQPPLLWQILITTIPHRHQALLGLLADLDRQLRAEPSGTYYYADTGVLLYRDNLAVSYGGKIAALTQASTAEYVSCIDDDDLFAPDGVDRVRAALRSRPDYVGFAVRWTRDGAEQVPVEHSLRHGGWSAGDGLLKRDISEKNPMRRKLALAGTWEGGYGAEARWADSIRAAGQLAAEERIPPPAVYWYRENTGDTFQTPRVPVPPHLIEPLPAYQWLAVLSAPGSC